MQQNHINFYSHILGRDLQVVITGHWGTPILMFPTSMGNVTQNIDFGLMNSISNEINQGKVKVYHVESIDKMSFYNKELPAHIKIYNYNLYTRFLKEELIPFIQKDSNTHRIGVAGCSFGAYHAANIAFKEPDLFSFLICMSGAFSIKSFMKGFFNDEVYFNNPEDFMANAESWKFNHLKIVLGTSEWDICKADNVKMSSILGERQINHWYDEKKWANHDWPLWNMMFPEYINSFLN